MEALVNKFIQTAKEKNKKEWYWKWILGGVAFLIISLAIFLAWRKSQLVALLKHEKRVAEEERRRKELEQKLTRNLDEQARLEIDIAALDKVVINKKIEIASREEDMKLFERKLKDVKDWKRLNAAFDR